MERSMTRLASTAGREGCPSRRIKEPGIRPTAYSFSSKSTDRGKKSTPSLGRGAAVTATSTEVSP